MEDYFTFKSRRRSCFTMKSGELSFDFPPSLRVTWTIPDFFHLATMSSYSLQSPDFPFADGRYYLRIFDTMHWGLDFIGIELLSVTDPDPGKAVLYDVQVNSGAGETDMRRLVRDNKIVFYFDRSRLESERDLYVPDGTLKLLCSVRPGKQRLGGTAKSGVVIPPHRVAIGELSSVSTPSLYVTWTIPGFLKMSRESTHILDSPEFHFSDRRHHLRLVQYGVRVLIHLLNLSDSDPGRYVTYEVVLNSTAGEEIHIDRSGTSTTRNFCISRDDLDCIESECFPDGHLTVFCCMASREPSSAGSPKSGGAETPGSKSVGVQTSNEEGNEKGLPGNRIAHKTTILDNVSCVIQTEDASNGNGNRKDEKVSSIDTKDDALLRERMKLMLTKGSDYDVTICVRDKEFRAHRMILSARSPVLAMMLAHDTKESNTGTISIEDCDPESFEEFLLYVYSGRTENLTPSKALQLYYTADKYDLPLLKERCVNLLKTSLSVTSICDVVLLAAKHQERELLEMATEFFAQNMEEILVTVKWQIFMAQNLVVANELYIKGMKILIPRK